MSKSRLNSKTSKPLESVSAPLGDDSDDEFNVAALVAETEAAYKPKKRGGRGRPRNDDEGGKTNRKGVLDAMKGDPLPLLLGLTEPSGSGGQGKLTDSWASVSKREDMDTAREGASSPALKEEEDTATESEEDNLPSPSGNILGKRPSKSAPPSPQKKPRPYVPFERTSKPCASSGKKSKTYSVPDPPSDTETETETDEDFPPPSSAGTTIPSSSAKSATTSKSCPSLPEFEKPPFPPPADQQHLGPLLLASPIQGHNVRVPAPINRHLREYQRDGVRFFHQRWAEGRGGLIGDDMGL
ncbi:hypothetical protein FRC11_006769, partial [Ceratobasidium sp. 423]